MSSVFKAVDGKAEYFFNSQDNSLSCYVRCPLGVHLVSTHTLEGYDHFQRIAGLFGITIQIVDSREYILFFLASIGFIQIGTDNNKDYLELKSGDSVVKAVVCTDGISRWRVVVSELNSDYSFAHLVNSREERLAFIKFLREDFKVAL